MGTSERYGTTGTLKLKLIQYIEYGLKIEIDVVLKPGRNHRPYCPVALQLQLHLRFIMRSVYVL